MVATDTDTTTNGHGHHKPFQRRTSYEAGARVNVQISPELRDRLEAERERIDPAVDSDGRPRAQRGLHVYAEWAVGKGLDAMAALPTYSDPLAQ